MSRGRVGVIAVLLVALLGAGLAQTWVRSRHDAITTTGTGPRSNRSSLSGMNSFAMALLLGGLRGPLVMMLWSTSETQKNDRNLEDLDTKIEWIRLLQPEFDTVHLYQIWNKAYNISVQMASLANKYATILDAVDYALSVNAERPGSISILFSTGQVYSEKLGQSNEKLYYRKRVRQESLPHASRQQYKRGDPLWRREQMDPVLDAQGRILPELRQELAHLVELEPFPYGVPPHAFGYNYYKKAQYLLREQNQHHPQLADSIVDAQPASSLFRWSAEERERAQQVELRALSQPVPEGREALDLATASIGLDAKLSAPGAVEEAMFSYALASRLADLAVKEFESHSAQFPERRLQSQSPMNESRGISALSAGDRDFLTAMQGTSGRQALIQSAAEHYRRAKKIYSLLIFNHYVEPQMLEYLLPPNLKQVSPDELTPEQADQLMRSVRGFFEANPRFDVHRDDRLSTDSHLWHAEERLRTLQSAGVTTAALGPLR